MERIKIPTNAIEFIINLFKNRVLKVITDFGLTQEIIAGDGLDQGETISPLLWRIFYDPLINKIQNNPELGYIMTTNWKKDLNLHHREKIEIRVAATAFMDDTVWISSSRRNMQKILDEAAIFYKANDSQINSKKSVLIAINAPKEDQNKEILIGPNKDPLKKIPKEAFARYLGIWIGEKNQKSFTYNLLQREIYQVTHSLKGKKTTDKQMLYILNRVLMPRLEYRSQCCFFNEREYTKLTAKYMRIFKNSINISSTCPNSVALHKGIYNLKSMWDLQNEALISNFTNRINDTNNLGTSTIIRLKDFQIANWEPSNILKKRTYGTFKTKNNFQANVLLLAHDHGISYYSPNLHNFFDWRGGTISIKETLNDQILYNKAIKSLSKSNLMYIDQLIDPSNKTLLDWQVLISLINKNNKGRPPLWYQSIKKKVTTDSNDNKLKKYYANLIYTNNHYKWTHQISKDNRSKEWIISQLLNQEMLWGKIIDKGNQKKNLKKTTVTYYTTNTSDLQELILTPCDGCILKDHQIDPSAAKCGFKLNKKEIRGIKFLNKRKSKRNNIPHDKNAIIDNISKELFNNKISPNTSSNQSSHLLIPSIHSYDFGSSLIYKWISTESYQKQLIQAYENNIMKDPNNIRSTYEFYMDGSLKNRGNKYIAMGSS